jgi:suppressor for copper-sensitivity B
MVILSYLTTRIVLIASLWLAFTLTICAQVQDSTDENVQLSILSENQTLGDNPKIWIGLRIQLASGWKAYWRSPGVAGYGVRLDWTGVKNIKSAQIHWPIPRRFHTEFGTVNIYEGDCLLPISLEVKDLSEPIHGNVKVDMLICDKSLCVPIQKSIHINLSAGTGTKNTADSLWIQKALSQVPSQVNDTSIKIEDAEILGNDIPPTIRVSLSKTEGFSSANLPEVFMEMDGYFLDAPLFTLSKDHKSIIYSALIFPNENRIPAPISDLDGKPLKITVGFNKDGKNYGFEVEKVLHNQYITPGFLLGILLIAFLGGLILNIMPCVMPVLSLKVFSVVRQGGRDYKSIRQEFLATAMGIIFSFVVLALLELSLKMTGQALGWGVQFQQPIFIIALIVILIVFASSLFGLFEFRLPYFMSSLGGLKPHHESLIGSFLEGSLVTILATPCTAPFVGTALAFSLARGPLEIFMVFIMMGLGLSSPFLLLVFFPSLAAKLPKSGPWMIRVKYFMGFLLILTAIWLLYVLKGQVGMRGSIIVATLMTLILIIFSYSQLRSERVKNLSWILISALIGISLTVSLSKAPRKTSTADQHNLWQPFEPTRIAAYVKANKVVFVNVTADWCLTCQINKYFVLKNQAVLEELNRSDVITMEADWTNHDQVITSYLETFNQYGIPFYAVYGCRNRTGTFLGQVLTPQKVINAIRSERCRAEDTRNIKLP